MQKQGLSDESDGPFYYADVSVGVQEAMREAKQDIANGELYTHEEVRK